MEMMTFLSEEKVLKYLALYNKAILYQKVGYLLEYFKDSLKLSDKFFDVCMQKKGKSKRYFTESMNRDRMIYNSKWAMMVPPDLLQMIE